MSLVYHPRSVLITGGTGSFGHAFVKHALAHLGSVERLIVLSRDEFKQSEMRRAFHDNTRLRFFLGDVRDRDRLRRAFQGVEVVIHAAAMKIVPAAERDPLEAVKTNVFGAQNVIEAALDAGVSRVVALSTDKAVNPVNLYGASKLCAERLFVAANTFGGESGTRFSCTRYGNVEDSRGSVIPLWSEQVRKCHALTMTDPSMSRFHMRQSEAVDLVLLALSEMQGGEVFIPKLPSYRLSDLADVIAGPGYPREVIGARPGEKQHESLIGPDESRQAFDCGSHYRILPMEHPWRGEIFPPWTTVPRGFEYRSDTAPMDKAQLRELLLGDVREAVPA